MSVFVDTGAWFAYFVRRDPDYNSARKWISANESPLVTSDYILDELFTLLKIRESHVVAVAAGRVLIEEKICRIIKVTPRTFPTHRRPLFNLLIRGGLLQIARAKGSWSV